MKQRATSNVEMARRWTLPYTEIGVETPSLKPSGSLNWNMRAPQ